MTALPYRPYKELQHPKSAKIALFSMILPPTNHIWVLSGPSTSKYFNQAQPWPTCVLTCCLLAACLLGNPPGTQLSSSKLNC